MITPFLWFDTQAEEAARYYVGIFKNSRIIAISHVPDSGKDRHGKPAGSVMVVEFELNGQRFAALNGGPQFQFDNAVSFMIECADQAEIDYYWEKLGTGGDVEARQCGWLKDKYGLSWQVTPRRLMDMLVADDKEAMKRAFSAMMEMDKLDIAEIEKAFAG
jgi:predicted 3-demethylubiquinone-9 3-methyltransferase (glyoxalase superfamily)